MDKKPQYGRRIVALLLLLTSVLLLSACGSREQNAHLGGSSSATPYSSPKGTLTGFVMAGPTCPGPVADGNPCPDKPVIHQQVQITTSDGHVIATVMTDQKGQFTITLAPGNYLLRANTSRVALHGSSSATPATILADHTTSLRITVDTGMR